MHEAISTEGQTSSEAETSPDDSQTASGSENKRALLSLLEAQHLEDLEAFGDEVTAVLELEIARARDTQASEDPLSRDLKADEGVLDVTLSVPVTAISSALQSVMPREDALRCLEAVTGVTGLLQQGLDLGLAVPQPQDIARVHRLLRAGTLLRPQRSYDLPGALAWALSRAEGARGAQSFGALPDVA